MQSRLETNQQLLDGQATALITTQLNTEGQDLSESLRTLQQSLSLRYPRCESMITLLNFFGQPRDEVLSSLFEHLKSTFDEQLRRLDEADMSRLLDQSKNLLKSPSLRFIPTAVIKQVKRKLPEDVMDYIIQEKLQQEFNNDIKTQVREYSQDFFISELGLDDERLQATDSTAEAIVKRLGKSNRLLQVFAQHCSKKFEDSSNQRWVEIFRRVCFKFHENGGELGALGQVCSFLRKLLREPLDSKGLKELYSTLRKAIITQANTEERGFEEEQRDFFQRHQVAESTQGELTYALSSLEKSDNLHVFLNPVTEAIAPGYFAKINHPVDISMMKRKLFNRRYLSLQEMHRDIQRMVENCAQYHGEDSDLAKYGRLVLTDWTKRWILRQVEKKPAVAKPPKVRPTPQRTEKRKFEEVETSPVEEKAVDNKRLKRLLKRACDVLRALDYDKIFEFEVTDDIAPGYSDEIESPICIQDMVQKVHNEEYDSLDELTADVELMVRNCLLYNGEDSPLGEYSLEFKRKWNQKKRGELLAADEGVSKKPKASSSSAEPRQESSSSSLSVAPTRKAEVVDKPKPVPVSVSTSKLDLDKLMDKQDITNCVEIVSNLDSWDAFKEKVDIPNYDKIIKKPMYLSIITQQLNQGGGTTYCFSQFDADVDLIFENCKRFNAGDGLYDKYAKLLQSAWKKVKQMYEVVRCIGWEERVLQLPFLKSEAIPLNKIILLSPLDRLTGANAADLSRVLTVAAQYLAEVDHKRIFLDPVNVKNYRKTISSPMDISTIKRNVKQGMYRSIDDFHEDVAKIARNCLRFNSVNQYGEEALIFYWKWVAAMLILEIKFPFFFNSFREDRNIRFYDENEAKSSKKQEVPEAKPPAFELTDTGSIKIKRKSVDQPPAEQLPKDIAKAEALPTPPAVVPDVVKEVREEEEQAITGKYADGTAIQLPHILTVAKLANVAEGKSIKKCLRELVQYLLSLDSDRKVLKISDSDKWEIKIDRGLFRTVDKAVEEVGQWLHNKYKDSDVDMKKIIQRLQYGCFLSSKNVVAFLAGKEDESQLDEEHREPAAILPEPMEVVPTAVQERTEEKMEVVAAQTLEVAKEVVATPDTVATVVTVEAKPHVQEIKKVSSQALVAQADVCPTAMDVVEVPVKSEEVVTPQPNARLLAYRLLKHQLPDSIQPIPSIITFDTVKFIVLLLKEKRVQDRLLGAATKIIHEKVVSTLASSSKVDFVQLLLEDASLRFCLQVIQIYFMNSLDLPVFNEELWKVYLPALILQCHQMKFEDLLSVPADVLVEAYAEKYPLPSQDGFHVENWRDRLKRWIEDLRRLK